MYLTKRPHVDDHGESSAVDAIGDDVIVIIENEQRSEVDESQRQQELTVASSSTDDRKTRMQQYSSTQTLTQRDVDEEELEREEPNDNVIIHFTRFSSRESEYRYRTRVCFQIPAATERRVSPRMIVIGWDRFRSRLMLFLIGCLLIWACIFFPLLGS